MIFIFKKSLRWGEGESQKRPPDLIAAPSIFSPEGYLEAQFGIRFQRS
nr:MAG TPA: hypothetical protein [Caudoviricetes sp.]